MRTFTVCLALVAALVATTSTAAPSNAHPGHLSDLFHHHHHDAKPTVPRPAPTEAPNFFELADPEAFDAIVQAGPKRPVVVDFWASWCGPCRTFGPKFHSFSKGRLDADFLKVQVDNEELESIVSRFGITRLPTVLVMLDGKTIGKAEPTTLETIDAMLDKLKAKRQEEEEKEEESAVDQE